MNEAIMKFTMQSVVVTALCSLILAMLELTGHLHSVVCTQININEDYLDIEDGLRQLMPSGDEDVLEHITKNKLKSSNPAEMVSEFAEIIEGLPDTIERDFFEYLVDMSDPDVDCDSVMLRYAYAIISLAKVSNEPAVRDYLGYLKLFGQKKFGSCAKRIKFQFEANRAEFGFKVEKKLDAFFSAFMVYKDGQATDATLGEVAKRVDLSNVTFDNFSRILQVFTIRRSVKDTLLPAQIIRRFIESHCDSLQEHFKVMFGIYNLARALGAQVKPTSLPVKFIKFNEYNRVCYTWQRNPEKALANLKRQSI